MGNTGGGGQSRGGGFSSAPSTDAHGMLVIVGNYAVCIFQLILFSHN